MPDDLAGFNAAMDAMSDAQRAEFNARAAALDKNQSGPDDYDSVGGALGLGIGQGVINIVNGLQDTAVGIMNLPILYFNASFWMQEQLGFTDNAGRLPYYQSPDWSKDMIVPENQFAHDASKFFGAAGVETLTGAVVSKFFPRPVVTGIGQLDNAASNVARTISKIGDLTKAEKAALDNIWQGGPRSQLPLRTREQLAELYSGVARQNPAGYAQSAFNQARADYLLGRGPNPGNSVNIFSERMGIPKFRGQ